MTLRPKNGIGESKVERDFEKEALASVKRNKRETLLFYVENFRGVPLGHVRICVTDKSGALKPTGKGITVKKAEFPEVIEGLKLLGAQLEAADQAEASDLAKAA